MMLSLHCSGDSTVEVFDPTGQVIGVYEAGTSLLLYDAPEQSLAVEHRGTAIGKVELGTGFADLAGLYLAGETLTLRGENGAVLRVGLGAVPSRSRPRPR